MIFVVMTWGLMGFICYKVAAKKGLNKGIWTLLGVLFGVFTLMIEILMPTKTESEHEFSKY